MTTTTKFKVKFGTPGRNVSAVVEAADEQDAIRVAAAKLAAEGEDREWIDGKVATGVWSRRNQGGQVAVEQYS